MASRKSRPTIAAAYGIRLGAMSIIEGTARRKEREVGTPGRASCATPNPCKLIARIQAASVSFDLLFTGAVARLDSGGLHFPPRRGEACLARRIHACRGTDRVALRPPRTPG